MDLCGRRQECAVIDGLLARVRRARGAALVLSGEPGIGKTTMLSYAAGRATGMRVLRVAGVPPEAELPFAAAHRLLRPVLPLLDRIPYGRAAALREAFAMSTVAAPDGSPVGSPDRFAVSLGVVSLLVGVAARGPVLCLVDDAQWLDGPSAEALAFAGRRLGSDAVVLLVAVRDGEAAGFPAAGLRRWRLTGIDDGAADRLVTQRFGVRIAADVRRSVCEAGHGNPQALLDIPNTLSAGQRLGHVPLPDPMPVGTGLEQVLLGQVRRLPAGAQHLMLIAAAESETDVVLEAAERLAAGGEWGPVGKPGVGAEALNAAVGSGLIVRRGGELVFRHPLVRSVVYRAAAPGRRREVHRTLVGVLSAVRDADRRAWHRAAQVAGVDDEVADELAGTVGRAGWRGGHAAVAAVLHRAAELTAEPQRRAARMIGAARAAWEAGRPAQAGALLEQVDAPVDPVAYAALRHVQGELELRCGLPAEGAKLLLDGAGQISRIDPGGALRMLLDAATGAVHAGDPAVLADVVRLAGQAAPGAPLVGVLAAAAGMPASGAASPDRLAGMLDQVARSGEASALVWGAVVAADAGDPGRGESLRRRAEAVARRSAAVGTLATVLEWMSWVEMVSGHLADAAGHAREGLELSRTAALANSACFHRAVLGWLAAARGDGQECAAMVGRAESVALAHGLAAQHTIALWARGLLDLGAGRWVDASVRLDALVTSGDGHPQVTRAALPDVVEAAVRAGRAEVARAAAVRFVAGTGDGGPPWQRALAARCRALTGPVAERAAVLGEALAWHEADRRPFAQARTQLLLGEHLRRERRRAEARPCLTAAAETFGRLGARPWEDRARAELRATGETARRRMPAAEERLTPQQLRIVDLVAAGATNKEVAARLCLSTRTVDYHLRNVFVKLGIGSRADLIRLHSRSSGGGEAAYGLVGGA